MYSMQWHRTTIPAFVALLSLSDCATGSQLDTTIQESAYGGVYLERIPVSQFQASHPIRLPPELIAKSLQGLEVRDGKGLLQSFSSNQSPTKSVFSPDEIALFAPAIAQGLSQAAADQQVGFRIVRPGETGLRDRTGAGVGSSGPAGHPAAEQTTAGKLFVYGRSLYLTLHQFRDQAEPPDNINMPNRRLPEPTGLRNRTVLFVPESALRPDIYAPAFAAENGLTTLVIDYDALAKAPAALPASGSPLQPSPAAAPATAPPLKDDLQQIKEQMKQKESEVEELRKELQDIKRQLESQPLDRGQTPARKSIPARPGGRQP